MKVSTIKINILKATSRLEELKNWIEDYFDLIIEGEIEASEKDITSLKTITENFRDKISELDGIAEEAEDSLESYIKELPNPGLENIIEKWIVSMGYNTESRNVNEDAKKLLLALTGNTNEDIS